MAQRLFAIGDGPAARRLRFQSCTIFPIQFEQWNTFTTFLQQNIISRFSVSHYYCLLVNFFPLRTVFLCVSSSSRVNISAILSICLNISVLNHAILFTSEQLVWLLLLLSFHIVLLSLSQLIAEVDKKLLKSFLMILLRKVNGTDVKDFFSNILLNILPWMVNCWNS